MGHAKAILPGMMTRISTPISTPIMRCQRAVSGSRKIGGRPTPQNIVLITCEHGGNDIPARYRHLFSAHESVLETHRAYDAGALVMARDLSSTLGAPLFAATTSRLLVDLNRSLGHPHLFSEFTAGCTDEDRQHLLDTCYLPYRKSIELFLTQSVADGSSAIHLSSHSFTPVLNGISRNADLGLLYDPARPMEAMLCRCLQVALKARLPDLKTRLNYPYSGKSDGFTTHLRRKFTAAEYVGIEIEVNQKHVIQDRRHWAVVRQALASSLADILGSFVSGTHHD